jgi:hypothetical protein
MGVSVAAKARAYSALQSVMSEEVQRERRNIP